MSSGGSTPSKNKSNDEMNEDEKSTSSKSSDELKDKNPNEEEDKKTKEKSIVLIIRGDDSGIETELDNDTKLISSLFSQISRVEVISYQSIKNHETLIDLLGKLKTQKKYENLLLWFTGHSKNVGTRYPAITFNKTTKSSKVVFTGIVSLDFKLFVMVIDACNVIKKNSKLMKSKDKDKSNLNTQAIKKNGMSNIIFNNFQGNALIVSSDEGKPSYTNNEHSQLTLRLLKELYKRDDWDLAFEQTRSKLYYEQRPYYESNLDDIFNGNKESSDDDETFVSLSKSLLGE